MMRSTHKSHRKDFAATIIQLCRNNESFTASDFEGSTGLLRKQAANRLKTLINMGLKVNRQTEYFKTPSRTYHLRYLITDSETNLRKLLSEMKWRTQ
jgi:hypothetical protein